LHEIAAHLWYNVLPLYCAFHNCSNNSEKILEAETEEETEEAVNTHNSGIIYNQIKPIRIIIRKKKMNI
jgi:hypothetical protein